MRKIFAIALLGLALASTGCKRAETTQDIMNDIDRQIADGVQHQQEQKREHPTWIVQAPKVNPVDGSRDQILVLHAEGRPQIAIVLAFHNGRLYQGDICGVRIDVDGFVTTEGSNVRLRFDDGKISEGQWAGTDSHESLFPSGYQVAFLKNLMSHTKLAFEFSLYEGAPQTVTFNIAGLSDVMKTNSLIVAETSKPHKSECDPAYPGQCVKIVRAQDIHNESSCVSRGFDWQDGRCQ
jgi:hypothetical protein